MSKSDTEFIGFDLGHGETALGRAYGRSLREPEILEYQGLKSFVTAVAETKGEIKIGSDAVNLAAMGRSPNVWVKFKGRDLSNMSVAKPTQLFTQTLTHSLARDKKIQGPQKSRFIVGCPSGWDMTTRQTYQNVFETAGLKTVRIAPESRAALMTALEQGYLSLEAARSSVLIIDIGSSTTDFTYCQNLEAEDVGHNILGSGLLDAEIFERNLSRQKSRKKIEKLIHTYPHYRPIMEYWCRLAKEQFFNGQGTAVEMIKRLPIDSGIFFEIRLDQDDAKAILSTPIKALNDYTWPDTFDYALQETVERLGGRAPDTILLTGGASRLPLIAPACEKAFPNAQIIQGAEPEFAIARGLAWLGRFEYLHASFKNAVDSLMHPEGSIFQKAHAASLELGDKLAPALIDALSENCILPAFKDWRVGKIDTLSEMETHIEDRVKDWLESDEARQVLRPVIDDWFANLQRNIEQDTDPLCRNHGLPAMVLSLDDSQHISQYLHDVSLTAPQLAHLESDTALAGTTLSAILISLLLAKANLLAPLLSNPIGLVVGGAVAGGGFIFGRKALAGRLHSARIPILARQALTNSRIQKAINQQREDMILSVHSAWHESVSEKFSGELINSLQTALTQRANDRAVLFLI